MNTDHGSHPANWCLISWDIFSELQSLVSMLSRCESTIFKLLAPKTIYIMAEWLCPTLERSATILEIQEWGGEVEETRKDVNIAKWRLATYQRWRSCFDVIHAVIGFALILSTSTITRKAAQPVVCAPISDSPKNCFLAKELMPERN